MFILPKWPRPPASTALACVVHGAFLITGLFFAPPVRAHEQAGTPAGVSLPGAVAAATARALSPTAAAAAAAAA
ncbi:MAG: hypothetical protein HUU30_09630, partial [Burkholderiaceae bacterium]|nr:hypothetical protein [Burkholderiaceae bacterium]